MNRPMKSSLAIALALAVSAAGVASAQSGLTAGHGGIGLRIKTEDPAPAVAAQGGDMTTSRPATQAPELGLYGGLRDAPRHGLSVTESYGGILYSPSRGWESSLEAGFAQDTLLSPRRYSLAGQMQSPLSNGKSLSMGLKYRVFDSESGLRAGPAVETPGGTAYSLAPS